MKLLHHRKHIIAKVVRRIISIDRCGTARSAKSSPRDAVDVMPIGELWSEAVEAMRRIAVSG
jgi:hypothetical protein